MCGIFGVVSLKDRINKTDLIRCTRMLAHRGPDFQDFFLSEDFKVGLGHTRLSILDLSSDANQPFHSPCGRYVMVYNGEVYNFKEIGSKLKDVTLRTSSDTEVILNAFIQWGPGFVEYLNGMFAIAIWDKHKQQLYLYRDRMGIKPLYLYESEDLVAFSSELKSLINFPSIKANLKLEDKAFHTFMHLGYIPEPFSVYKNISKFTSGSHASFDRHKGIQTHKYWELEDQLSSVCISDEGKASKQLENLLHQSIERRLVSDVPLGTFLSGGIDSSTVTSIAAKLSGTQLNTFSIGFHDSRFDESEYAKEIADQLGTNHTEFMLSEQDAIPYLEKITGVFDEPFADTSAIPTMLISKLASEHVKVILTGDGGDEQFLGYGSYNWANRLGGSMFSNNKIRSLMSSLLKLGNSRYKRIANLFETMGNEDIRSHIFSQEQYFFGNKELERLINSFDKASTFSYRDSETTEKSPAELQAIFDLSYYLKDDLLVKVDRSSMSFGLECRVPLLDHELLEFSLSLDKSLKFRSGASKYLLKKVLHKNLPKKLFDRPKWGFGIPLDRWLQGEMTYLIDDLLNNKITKDLGFFHEKQVEHIISRFNKGETFLYNRIWLMIAWHKWFLESDLSV